MVQGCGFLYNGRYGINTTNDGRIYACRGGTHGPQPYLVNAFLNNSAMTFVSCRIEGIGGFERH